MAGYTGKYWKYQFNKTLNKKNNVLTTVTNPQRYILLYLDYLRFELKHPIIINKRLYSPFFALTIPLGVMFSPYKSKVEIVISKMGPGGYKVSGQVGGFLKGAFSQILRSWVIINHS